MPVCSPDQDKAWKSSWEHNWIQECFSQTGEVRRNDGIGIDAEPLGYITAWEITTQTERN